MPTVPVRMLPRFALWFAAARLLAAQPAAPTWKEFSIGPARDKQDAHTNNVLQGLLRTESISLKALIGIATGIPPTQVEGPGWLDTEHYAVVAVLSDESRLRLRTRSPNDPRVVEEFRSLLTQELVHRFHLAFHTETRNRREYLLGAAEGGPIRFRPTATRERGSIGVNSPALSFETTLEGRNVTFRTLGAWLQNHLDEPVTISPTLPPGNYDFQLTWRSGDDSSLFAALREQLGLDMRAESHTLERLFVDHIERPATLFTLSAPESPTPAIGSPDSSIRFTPAQLRRDLRIVRDALEEGHPGIYRFTPKDEMDRVFDRANAQLDRPMTALEFYRVVAPAVAALKCGHTELEPSRAIQQRVAAEPLLPIEAAILGGKVYVARDFSEERRLAGTEILSINDVPIQKILASILAVVHGDGDSATAGPYQLSRGREFARNLYLIAGVQSPFKVRHTSGATVSDSTVNGMTLNAMQEVETTRYSQPAKPANASWRLLEGGSAGVLKISSFGGKAEDGTPLRDFFDRVFTELQAKNIGRLILDVRDNGGGEDELGRRLFSYFAGQPYRYYRDLVVNQLRFRFFRYVPNPDPPPPNIHQMFQLRADKKYHFIGHPNWGIQQPASPHFGGQVVVLMNGGSFSTTCEFLATLHSHGGATFVGEETGGGYYGNTSGDSATIVLPNSKLMLPVQLVGYYMAIEGRTQGTRGIRPDRPVAYSIDDVLKGRDKEMEEALRLVGAR